MVPPPLRKSSTIRTRLFGFKLRFERNIFSIPFAPLDDVIVACGAGAIALGFPVITNETENIAKVPKSLIVQEDVSKFNATSLDRKSVV